MAENDGTAPVAEVEVKDETSVVLQKLSDSLGTILEAHPNVQSVTATIDWNLPSAVALTLPVGVWRVSKKEITPAKAVAAVKQLARMINYVTSVAYKLAALAVQPAGDKQAALESIQQGAAYFAKATSREELDLLVKQVLDSVFTVKGENSAG